MSYSKLHSSIVNSSLWSESDSVVRLFITLMAMCDREGYVYGSRSGLTRSANIQPYTAEDDPWERLLAPDPDSSDRMRAPENEGRRIEEVSGGFRLLNFEYYRGLRNDDDRRDQNRAAQTKWRERQGKPTSASVSQDKPASADVSHGKPPSAHAETDADASQKKRQKSQRLLVDGSAPDVPRYGPDSFEMQLAVLLDEKIRANLPAAKVPNWQAWSRDMDLLCRVDQRSDSEVRKVIAWCQADSFWWKNILSPATLRKQYDKLTAAMKSDRGGWNGGKPQLTAADFSDYDDKPREP